MIISGQLPTPGCSSVAKTAIPMPTAAIWLPRTAVRGPRSIRSPVMNIEKATMYSRLMKSSRLTIQGLIVVVRRQPPPWPLASCP